MASQSTQKMVLKQRKHRSKRLEKLLNAYDQSNVQSSSVRKVEKDVDDTSSYSTHSSSTSSLADSESPQRRVSFFPQVSVKHIKRNPHCRTLWMNREDLNRSKEEIREESYRFYNEHQSTMENLYSILRQQNYTVVDVDEDAVKKNATWDNECLEELARIINESEGRGLERYVLAHMDILKGRATRPTNIHWRKVMRAQESSRNRNDKVSHIAESCQTSTNSVWAAILGQSDANAVHNNFMLNF